MDEASWEIDQRAHGGRGHGGGFLEEENRNHEEGDHGVALMKGESGKREHKGAEHGLAIMQQESWKKCRGG